MTLAPINKSGSSLLAYVHHPSMKLNPMNSIKLPGFATPVLVSSIFWIESDANYSRIHFQDGTTAIVTKPLNYFGRYAGFLRVHRSSMVNFAYIYKVSRDASRSMSLQLANGKSIPVSRPYHPLVEKLFINVPVFA